MYNHVYVYVVHFASGWGISTYMCLTPCAPMLREAACNLLRRILYSVNELTTKFHQEPYAALLLLLKTPAVLHKLGLALFG